MDFRPLIPAKSLFLATLRRSPPLSYFAPRREPSHPPTLPIKLVASKDSFHVLAGAGKIDVRAKSPFSNGGSDIIISPALGATGAGVIFREGERSRRVLVLPMLESPA